MISSTATLRTAMASPAGRRSAVGSAATISGSGPSSRTQCAVTRGAAIWSWMRNSGSSSARVRRPMTNSTVAARGVSTTRRPRARWRFATASRPPAATKGKTATSAPAASRGSIAVRPTRELVPPRVEDAEEQNSDEHEHLHERDGALPYEHLRPWIHEHHLHVEGQEQQGHRVVAHVEAAPGVGLDRAATQEWITLEGRQVRAVNRPARPPSDDQR